MMGRNLASSLGIDVNSPGVTSTTVLGIGGDMRTFQGYNVDQLAVPTSNGGELVFNNIVVFVPGSGDLPADLPGIFGMNLINNSFSGLEADLFGVNEVDPVQSAFSDWYVVPVPEPSAFILLAVGAAMFLLRRFIVRRRSA